jgi:hypothetical protein
MYAGSEDGEVIHIVRQVPTCGSKARGGYLIVGLRRRGVVKHVIRVAHRFIWECYYGSIVAGYAIDHINGERCDNRLENLALMSNRMINLMSAKNRDYSFAAKNHKNRKYVRAVNCVDNVESFYNSLYAVNQHLGINAGTVKMACEGLNNVKSGISKKDGCRYTFNYVSKEELPEDHKRSANIHPRKAKV